MKQVVRTPKLCKRCGVEFPADPPRTNKRPACSVECAAWLHVEKRGPDECWLWTGFVDATGYGQFGHESKSCKPHRVILAEKLGRSLTPEECCMHACDTPLCCNPAHLFVGTRADNNADMRAKGRARGGSMRGESHPSAKLSDAQTTTLRADRAATGLTYAALGVKYGISKSQAYAIATGKRRRPMVTNLP